MNIQSPKRFLIIGLSSAVLLLLEGLWARSVFRPDRTRERTPVQLRMEPAAFPAGTCLPPIRERAASGSIDLSTFRPERDIVRIEDSRVWWESDHDSGDNENDHLFHVNLVRPFRRLVDKVEARGGRLKVQDTYRPSGRKHTVNSLHMEGRAIDLTARNMSLEELAKLCWVCGFDWVFHENGKTGAHVHCSVRRD